MVQPSILFYVIQPSFKMPSISFWQGAVVTHLGPGPSNNGHNDRIYSLWCSYKMVKSLFSKSPVCICPQHISWHVGHKNLKSCKPACDSHNIHPINYLTADLHLRVTVFSPFAVKFVPSVSGLVSPSCEDSDAAAVLSARCAKLT